MVYQMNYSVQELAKEIKAARMKKRISQRALSAKIGIPQSHISKIENGAVNFQVSSLIEITRALDVELILVSRVLLPAVQAIQRGLSTSKQIPAYRPDEEEENDT